MALIKCEHCGHSISDKAPFCPKCGYLRVKAVSEENLNPRGSASPPTSNAPLKTPKGLWAMGIIGLLILAGGIVWLVQGIHNHNEQYLAKLEFQRLERLRIEEQQRLEAILLQEEQERLDSIRQDSISRNFKTPDLQTFDLKGHVKTCSVTTNVHYFAYWFPYGLNSETTGKGDLSYVVKFDEDGNLMNPPIWSNSVKNQISKSPWRGKKVIERNEDGFIYKFNDPSMDIDEEIDGMTTLTFLYSQGKLSSVNRINEDIYDYSSSPPNISFIYDSTGDLIKMKNVHGLENTYTNYVYDDYGNWISRDCYSRVIDAWEHGFTEDFQFVEKRSITYY